MMSQEPLLASLTFALGHYQLACALQQGQLVLRVATTETRSHQLTLAAMNHYDNQLELTLATALLATHSSNTQSSNNREEPAMQRVASLEGAINDLSRRFETQSRTARLPKPSNRSSRGNLKEGGSSLNLRERGDQQISGIIQREVEQNMKLEMLNDILQEKLLRREGELLELERSLLEREELIRELAEKLITANIEKEDIFNEYEKILQTNVFHQDQDEKTREQQEEQKEEQSEPTGEAESARQSLQQLPDKVDPAHGNQEQQIIE